MFTKQMSGKNIYASGVGNDGKMRNARSINPNPNSLTPTHHHHHHHHLLSTAKITNNNKYRK